MPNMKSQIKDPKALILLLFRDEVYRQDGLTEVVNLF